MKKVLVLFVLLFVSALSHAQNLGSIDSLTSLIKSASEDEQKVDVYNELAWEYRKSFPDSTLFYTDKAIEIISSQPKTALNNFSKAYNYQGVAYYYKGDQIKAFDFYTLAAEEGLNYGDSSQYAHALNNLGRLFMTQGDFLKSYDYYHRAKKIFEELGDRQGLGYSYKSLAELYEQHENYTKALEMSSLTLAIRREFGNLTGQISILKEMAEINQQMGDYQESHDYYFEALSKSELLGDAISSAGIELGIADLYFVQGKYDSSHTYANKALRTSEMSGNENLKVRVRLLMAKILYKRSAYSEAEKVLREIVVDSSDLAVNAEIYEYLALICKNRDDDGCALDNFKKYHALNGKLNDAAMARNIERMEARLELEKREKENELLKTLQARDQALIDRQRLANIVLVAVIATALFLIIILWLTGKKRRAINESLEQKNKEIVQQQNEIESQNEKINHQNDQLRDQNKNLLTLNNEKDTLINVVAHDLKSPFARIQGLAQVLGRTELNEEQQSLLKMQLEVAKSGLDLIKDLLEINAFEDDRDLDEVKLVNINELLTEKYHGFVADAETKNVSLQVHLPEEEIEVRSGRLYLSRILDNLLSNAIKFSISNTKVILSAARDADFFVISVKDFGQGFSESDKKNLYKKFTKLSARPTAGESSNGLGLAIVKNLVDKLGGEIILISEYGKGSEFVLKFPTALSSIKGNQSLG
ncbi:tetratricopeptide repeat-containing sensor histidine kinase [Fulvivirga ligni]|uniref:tetratricopeptide repeat-containing sensor histidine kinase n=1 Tax=Fulvivirga ligni TaxID=2904246 RepID=UPI001F1D0117|nr:tetratricopeptide repeat protein [Fulvivirga ligni]UII21058.1 tetratricopeptide repeat protein [Fulvivirga ligni]